MASPYDPSEQFEREEPQPHETDTRDRSAVWIHEVWDCGAPRSWSSPGWIHVCGTTQGGRTIVSQLTKMMRPIETQARVLEHLHSIDDGAHYMAPLCKWASLLSKPVLIAIDRGGGTLGGLYTVSATSPCEWSTMYGETTLEDARRTFATHGLLLAVDVSHLKSCAFFYHPDVAEKAGGIDKLLAFEVAESQCQALGLPPKTTIRTQPALPPPQVPVVDDVEEAAIERAERASRAARAALAAASVY